jgi:hypothetical protein
VCARSPATASAPKVVTRQRGALITYTRRSLRTPALHADSALHVR